MSDPGLTPGPGVVLDGVLVLDKPAGPTSHDVVARVRRALRIRRIGHTGTLDPLATGVLPLVVGRATRLAQFLATDEKEYAATLRFGRSTATHDAEGLDPGGHTNDAGVLAVTPADIELVLAGFRGTYLQVPPPFSAKKIDGIPAYRLARAQKPVDIRPVEVTVHGLDLVACDGGTARLRVVCSSGFYVRTLAHEIGQRLGCGAYLAALRRTRAGDFTLNDAVPLETLEAEPAEASSRLVSVNRLLPRLPAVVLNERGATRARHGNSLETEDLSVTSGVPPQAPPPGATVRLFDEGGALLGIASSESEGLLHPRVVLV